MKLVVDLLACQTDSRFRGIGRYTHALVTTMAKLRGLHQMTALANAQYTECFEDLRRDFLSLLPRGSFLPYQHTEINETHGENSPNFNVATTLVQQAYQMLEPDCVLYPSIFEGWGEKGVVPLPTGAFPSALKSVIVYDFIPYIYAERFLQPDPYFRQYYTRRFEALKEFDVLLAISESTRQDSIRLLGLPAERVVNISAAASSIFRKKTYTNQQVEDIQRRFGITKPFIFYTGNVEYHKNMDRALRAFAQLPREVQKEHQIVLTHTGEVNAFRSRLSSYGLSEQDVIITGHISDEDLVDLYNICRLYIFPSLYEGFGLPILEAMACGAPVIASSTSSIPEVIGRADAMFDPTSDDSITSALHTVLTSSSFREELSNYGLERAREFSWEKSAQTAWQALEDAQERKSSSARTHVQVPGNKSRLRVAYVSPLPPQKSGIADYSADLLPALAKYVDLDVFVEPDVKVSNDISRSIRSTYTADELVKRQDQYDVVVYQFGNSKFHRHMYSLLKAVPGVVVLHDFYLSHIREYLYSTQYIPPANGNFFNDVGNDHGLFSMIDMIRRGLQKAIWDWPVNWDVLKLARKLIVHSDYQNTLIETFYGNGWYPRATVIPQVHKIEPHHSAAERAAWREELGFSTEQFAFCSFGFVNPTKLPLLIVEAFARVAATNRNARLIFVGEMEQNEATAGLPAMLEQYQIADRVQITGFVSDETYQGYLRAADAAIQLRINSRGETSRAVLDCMAVGLPTIINAHGSLNDYQDSDVIKLQEQPGVDALSQAMDSVMHDTSFRETLSTNARATIENRHHPDRAAEEYFATISAAAQTNDRALFAPLFQAAVATGVQAAVDLPQAAQLAAKHWNNRTQPRLLIDVTNISYVDLRTGIQRVVKNLITGLYGILPPSHHVELVRINEGKLYRSGRFAEKLFELPENSLGGDAPVDIQPGDTLFMLDTSWNLFDQFVPVFETVRKAGGKIFTMLYDLIPVNHPHTCTPPTVEYFKTWINKALLESDEIICISNAVAIEAAEYVQKTFPAGTRTSQLSYIHLGADIPVAREESNIREQVYRLTEKSGEPFFLMVSTIEPRKGFDVVLDAFELLWQQGHNLRLCLIGKIGWNVAALEDRIRHHPALENRLFFIENATDAEVNLCYASATALITASMAEGFGLPIVEAALQHVPVIASDIPVFREVGGSGAEYFAQQSAHELAEAVKRMAGRSAAERRQMADSIRVLTWQQSAEWLLDILQGKPGRYAPQAVGAEPVVQTPEAAVSIEPAILTDPVAVSAGERSKKLWLYAPAASAAEMADLEQRLRFYHPGMYRLELLDAETLAEPSRDAHPVLQFCAPEQLPDALRALGPRVYFIDHRYHNEDAYEWARLSTDLHPPVDYRAAHERFLQVFQRLQARRLEKAYIFGTGPSLASAIQRDWRDGYRVVCNTIVRDPDLWWHLQPHFIVAADSRYHFGHTEFSRAFRADLQRRLQETETYFVYPGVFDAIARRELPDLHDRLLPLPYGPEKRIDVDLSTHYETPALGNVLPLMLLPLGCTFAKHVCLWGFDGRGPTDSLFWKNSTQHNYPELMHTLQQAHPAFFESYMPKPGANTYVNKYMGDELDQLLRAAEARGFSFEMLHPTWTETLQKRIVDPNIPRTPNAQP